MTSRELPLFVAFYLRLIAFITFGLGVCLIIWPSQMVNIFFMQNFSSSEFFVRMLGSTLIGYSSLNALAAYRPLRHSVGVAVWANLVTLIIASLISIIYIDLFDSFAWLMIGQHIVFVGGFSYCAWLLYKMN